MSNQKLRDKLKRYHRRFDCIYNIFIETGVRIEHPHFPEECIDMVCGAHTKAKGICQAKELYKNGRCKLHGGLSTGPKTIEGKRRSALNTGKTYEELTKGRINVECKYCRQSIQSESTTIKN